MLIHYEIREKEKFEVKKGIHKHYCLIILISGKYEYITQGVAKVILPHMPVFFKKGVAFEKTVIEPIKYISVQFSHLPEDLEIVPTFKDSERVDSSVFYLQQAIKNNQDSSVISHFAEDIVLLADRKKPASKDEMSDVINFVEHNYNEKLSLDYLSRRLGYSKQTLISKFRKKYGKTPIEFLTMIRVNHARYLIDLYKNSFSLAYIAEKCGYSDYIYFSRKFKQIIGISPRKYMESD